MSENEVGALSIVIIFVVFPIVLAYARMVWKRGSQPVEPGVTRDMAQRLVHMQQSIDAMAVEVERIAENQRFVTRLMAERKESLPAEINSRSDRAAG